MICKRVIYSGRVQGVGFRYTAQRVARGFPIVGYVKNLPNSSVELVAQGEAGQVEAFLQALAQQMVGYIRNAAVSDESPGTYEGFGVRY
jgi:acylphosphatase